MFSHFLIATIMKHQQTLFTDSILKNVFKSITNSYWKFYQKFNFTRFLLYKVFTTNNKNIVKKFLLNDRGMKVQIFLAPLCPSMGLRLDEKSF